MLSPDLPKSSFRLSWSAPELPGSLTGLPRSSSPESPKSSRLLLLLPKIPHIMVSRSHADTRWQRSSSSSLQDPVVFTTVQAISASKQSTKQGSNPVRVALTSSLQSEQGEAKADFKQTREKTNQNSMLERQKREEETLFSLWLLLS